MEYLPDNIKLTDVLMQAQKALFAAKRHKFIKGSKWRAETVPDAPGVYALYEGENKLIYVGETGNLRERMDEINRTVNHSFRKQYGAKYFGGKKSRKKFDDGVEQKLDAFFKEHLYVSFIEVHFGRLEIETFIVTKYQQQLLNSRKKRKSPMG